MHSLKISPSVVDKLKHKHSVTRREVEQCFDNRPGKLLVDNRELRTDKPAHTLVYSPH